MLRAAFQNSKIGEKNSFHFYKVKGQHGTPSYRTLNVHLISPYRMTLDSFRSVDMSIGVYGPIMTFDLLPRPNHLTREQMLIHFFHSNSPQSIKSIAKPFGAGTSDLSLVKSNWIAKRRKKVQFYVTAQHNHRRSFPSQFIRILY